jgi:plastocyanin
MFAMKGNFMRKWATIQKLNVLIYMIVLILGTKNIFATIHVVHFGGSSGLTYSPSSFSADIGDTVQWLGDFSAHPLSSTSIPANARTWHVASGSSFNYRIALGGEYKYKCDLHTGAGMNGSFTVSATLAMNHASFRQKGEGISSPMIAENASGQLFLKFTQLKTEAITLRLLDPLGRVRAIVFDGTLQAGVIVLPLDPKISGMGQYFLGFSCKGREISRIFIIR